MVERVDELVRRAAARDAAAFAALVREFERPLLAIGFAICQDAHAAGDIAQEAFLRAWQRLGELKEPARFGPWLCQIARRLAVDTQRRGHPATGEKVAEISAAIDPALQAQRDEQNAQLAAALGDMDETARMIVMMRYYDDLSAKEIAELLDMTPAAVDMRLSRARQSLKEKLETKIET